MKLNSGNDARRQSSKLNTVSAKMMGYRFFWVRRMSGKDPIRSFVGFVANGRLEPIETEIGEVIGVEAKEALREHLAGLVSAK